MKIGVLGFAIASLALGAVTSSFVAAQEEPTDAAPPAITQPANVDTPGAAPASVQTLKEKIAAINSARSATGVEDVIKLHQAGVDKGIIETYIRNSRIPSPTTQDLVYLKEQGIPEDLVKALIEHGRELREKGSTTPTPPAPPSPQQDYSPGGASYGPTYNNYVYSAPSSPAMAPSYGMAPSYAYNTSPSYYTAPSSTVTIIPYNPSRSYPQNIYSADFHSYYWGSYGYGSPYSYYGSPYGGGYYGPSTYRYCAPYRYGGYNYAYGPHRYASYGPYHGGGFYHRWRR